MNQHHSAHTKTHAQAHDDFLIRFRKNLLKELLLTLAFIGAFFRISMALLVGIAVFLRQFDFPKLVLALIIPPLFIFIVGNYFSLLSTNLVIAMTAISIMSLFLSEPGDNFVDWFSKIIDSLSEMAAGSSTPATLSQKLMGFVGFSAIASLFIVFIM
jgi:hypothetical protein